MRNRDKLFQTLLFDNDPLRIHSPMWGKYIPEINPDVFMTNKGSDTYALNIGKSMVMGGGLAGNGNAKNGDSAISIGAIGIQDPVAALDAICSEIADKAEQNCAEFTPEEISVFRRATKLIATETASSVFAGDLSPGTLASQLKKESPANPFGIISSIQEAVENATDRVRNAASTLGFGAVRGKLSPAIGQFFGDVFVYLKNGSRRNDIRNEIGQALISAYEAAKAEKGPLVVIGHSMGGVILVDMLIEPAAAGLPADLKIDALLTVGSQPGLFMSLDVLAKNPLIRKPDCVKHWLNVFDPIDPLAFKAKPLFQGVEDLVFNSITGVAEAHSKYFQRPQFYARSRVRLQALQVL
ncbi:alpha/beta fold hydrolase [Pseudocitrobacter cyperus]|uniref:DDHD domain-containing protein n=1 Tax=Pseudocitrobacter cyperus TaxID=3112843 RepID=A0ABV0HLZ6_9ENTR